MKRILLSKKIIFILVLCFLSIFSLNATLTLRENRFYLVPYASSDIDLRNWAYYPSRDGYENGLDWSNPNDGKFYKTPEKYTDKNMVMLGGYSVENEDEYVEDFKELLTGATMDISVSTDSGAMELVSQSNSAYRWPFEFWLIVKSSNNVQAGEGNKVISVFKVDETNMTFRSNPISFNSDPYPSSKGSVVFFDMIIAFPIKEGSFNKDNMTLQNKNGKTYYIAEKDDYASMVTVTMNLEKDGQRLGSGISLTVPFSGFYLKSDTSTVSDSLASLSVLLNAAASTLDLATENNRRVKIGSVNLMANYFQTDSSVPQHVHLFLSSSPNPKIAGDKFRFIKVGETIPTVANSLPFRLLLIGSDGYYDTSSISQQRVEFDGTLSSPVSSITSETEHKKYATAAHFSPNVYSAPFYNGKIHYFQYSGDLFIETDSVVTGQLVSGVYQEDVYVHVFSDY